MIKALYVTGYRPYELGIFNDKHPGIQVIKKAIEEQLRSLLENGLEWVVISGQQGIELWTAEIVIQLKKDYPNLKYSIITPFLNYEKNWNEYNQQKFHYIKSKADHFTSVTNREYEAPWQFIEKDKLIVNNTDGILLVYDEEKEGSPKYIKSYVEKYKKNTNYQMFTITAYDLQLIAEEMERENWN